MPNMHNFMRICFKELIIWYHQNVLLIRYWHVTPSHERIKLWGRYEGKCPLLSPSNVQMLQITTILTLIFIHFGLREGRIKMSDWWSNLTFLVWTISPIKQFFFKSKLWKTLEILNLEGNSGCLSASYKTGNKKLVFVGEKDPAYVITWNDTENIYESLNIS